MAWSGIAQEIPVHASYAGIYDLLDELATQGSIDLLTVEKPYSRKLISTKLAEALKNRTRLTTRQQKEILFYLKDYQEALKPQEFEAMDSTRVWRLWGFPVSYSPPGYVFRKDEVSLGLHPIYSITMAAGRTNNYRAFSGGGDVYLNAGGFGAYANFRDITENQTLVLPTYLTTRMGGAFKFQEEGRSSIDHSEMRGGLSYSWKWGSIGLVKDHIQWGDSYGSPLIFSGRTPSFPMLRFKLDPVDWFRLSYYHGWLVSEEVDSSRSYVTANGDFRAVWRNKYIAANLWSFRPFKATWISVGNSIVYADKPVNPAYLIPFLFYKSVDHTANNQIDNENSQFFINISTRALPRFHFFGSLFLDDLTIGRPRKNQFIAFKAGVRAVNWPLKNVQWQTEYSQSNPITFKHRVPTLTYESNRYNLGFYMRDNAREWRSAISYKPDYRLTLGLSYVLAQKSVDYPYLDGNEAEEYDFFEELIWNRSEVLFTITYQPVQRVWVRLTYGITDVTIHNLASAEEKLQVQERYSPDWVLNNPQIIGLSAGIGF